MRSGTLTITLALFGMCSATVSAGSGSSATAVTTISANIVPAASFMVTEPVILNRTTGATDHSSVMANPAGRVTLSSADPPQMQIRSSQDLVYDLSIPASISIPGIAQEVLTRFDEAGQRQGRRDTGHQFLLEITGPAQNMRTYKGLIDITVNYN